MKKFDKDSGDYPEMCSWYNYRKMTAPSHGSLPKHGYIVSLVAAGFLVSTDTCSCILDFYVTNPGVDKEIRTKAIYEITKALLWDAYELGFSKVLCRSQARTIKDAAKELGFKDLGEFSSFCKEI